MFSRLNLKVRLRPRRSKPRRRAEYTPLRLSFMEEERPWYLEEYINRVKGKLGEPLIIDKPTGDMKLWREFNVIYPVGDGIFIHVYSNPAGSGYNKYVVIEPPRPHPNLLKLVEEKIALMLTEEHEPRSSEEKKAILVELLNNVVELVDHEVDYEDPKTRRGRILVNKRDYENLVYHLVRDKVGVGVLEPFLRDPFLEDISCSGLGPLYVVHKIFGNLETNVEFREWRDLDRFVIMLAEKIGKPVSHARPIVDATLPDGSRINIVFGRDVSLRGSNFTIRRVAKVPISVTQLIAWGTFDSRIAAYMWMMLSEGMSAFICGESLAKGEKVYVRSKRTGLLERVPIEELEDRYHEYEVLCLDADGRLKFKPIGGFVKKPRTKPLFEVRTRSGRIIRVTGDHSLFTFKRGGLVPVKASEIKPGDRIAVPARVPLGFGNMDGIDLLSLLSDEDILVESDVRPLEEAYSASDDCCKPSLSEDMREGLEANNLWVRVGGEEHRIRPRLKVSPSLLRLIGLLYSCGVIKDNVVKLTFDDSRLAELAIGYVKDVLGAQPTLKVASNGKVEVNIRSKLLARILTKLGVRLDEQDRRLPRFVFGLKADLVRELVRSLLMGISSHGDDHYELRLRSRSLEFLEDLWYLLLGLGIEPRLESEGDGCYCLVVKRRDLDRLANGERLDDGSKTMGVDVTLDEVVEVRPYTQDHEYVYDLSVPGAENFVAGLGGVLAHNTASGKTTTLNAISAFIRPTAKIVTIEDTAEVVLPHPNWTRELTRDTGRTESSVTMFDLLKAALRQRPNYIIVGEIRGAEGNIAFQAMQSVTWDTPIVIRDERTGEVKILPIGEFVDMFYEEGEEGVARPIYGYQTLTLSDDGRATWAPISYVLRHRVNEVYEILVEGGGIIRATGSHSVFVLDERSLEIRPKPVYALRPGDILVSFMRERPSPYTLNVARLSLERWREGYGLSHGVCKIHAWRDPIAWSTFSGASTASSDLSALKRTSLRSFNALSQLLREFLSLPTGGVSLVSFDGNSAVLATSDYMLASMLIWTARLRGFFSRLHDVQDYDYYDRFEVRIDLRNMLGARYGGIPVEPLVKLVEQTRVRLPLEVKYTLRAIESAKHRLVSRRTALVVAKAIERGVSSLSPDAKTLLSRVKIIAKSDILLTRVVKVRRRPYRGYVYDISVPGTELFFGGLLPIALHNTGHPVLSTFHAADIDRLIQRITSHPINVPKTHLDALNIAWFQSAVYSKTGVLVRRVIKVYEILGYDPQMGSIAVMPVFTWDPVNDRFLFAGRGASYLLEEKIAVMRGIPRKRISEIYEELELRARFLQELVRRKVFNYYDVWKAVVSTYRLGLERALREVTRGALP